MGYFFAIGWGRRVRDERERARRDWNAIMKFAEDEGRDKGKVEGRNEGRAQMLADVAASRFPNDVSAQSLDRRSRLFSKSPKEIDVLTKVGANCPTFQDFTSRL